jgi:hypothetical protein
MWGWIYEFERQALATGDRERLRLVRLDDEAYGFREIDPDRALALFDEGRRLAERLGEAWWVLYYRRWHVHALLHFKRDYRRVLDLAVANTLEARKPQYDHFPQRISIHEDLVSAYIGIDPDGHAAAIAEALDYVEAQMPPSLECRLHLWGLRREFALQRRLYDEAGEAAGRSLAIIAEKPDTATARHYTVFVYNGLCVVHFGRGEWDRLAEVAALGEEAAHRVGHKLELSECVLWQALVARRGGDEDRARLLYTRATAQVGRLRMPPDDSYFDALGAFHELGGQTEAALAARDRELQAVEQQGRLACECRCRVQRCRLLGRLGRLTAEDLEPARASALRLRDPAPYLAELERIAGRGRGMSAP